MLTFRKGLTTATIAIAAVTFGSSPAFADCSHPTTDGHRTAHRSMHGISSHDTTDTTSKASLSAVVSGVPGQTAPLQVTADGALNYSTQQDEFTINEPNAQGGTESTKLIVDHNDLYVQVPQQELTQTGGKPWIKADAAQESESMGIDFDMLTSSQNMTDGDGWLKNVTLVGEEDQRGVNTKHYAAQLDFSAIAQQTSDENQKASLQQLAALYNNKPIDVNVWLDDQDQVRKMSFTLDLSNLKVPNSTPAEALTGTLAVSIELYDYGTPVDITVPSADQVITADELAATPQTAAPAETAAPETQAAA
jgi:hypothetical protein